MFKAICSFYLSAEYSITYILATSLQRTTGNCHYRKRKYLFPLRYWLLSLSAVFPMLWSTLRQWWRCKVLCVVRLLSLRVAFTSLAPSASLQETVCRWCSSVKNLELSRSKNVNKIVILKQFVLLQLLSVKKTSITGNHCTAIVIRHTLIFILQNRNKGMLYMFKLHYQIDKARESKKNFNIVVWIHCKLKHFFIFI